MGPDREDGHLTWVLLVAVLDSLAAAVFVSAPWHRRTSRILAGIPAVLLALRAFASWYLLWRVLVR